MNAKESFLAKKDKILYYYNKMKLFIIFIYYIVQMEKIKFK
jgi:hypothetical protein